MPVVHQDRNGCALHGALRLLSAIGGVTPITHANAGCTLGASDPGLSSATQGGWLEQSSTTLLERHIVFGGTSRLREQIKNTLKVQDADLYVVVTGCVPEIVGDDVPAMVKEAWEQQFPVLGIATPGFKGNGYEGYATALLSLIEQVPTLGAPEPLESGHINLLGLVPGLDPFWEGDLINLEDALAPLGRPIKRLLGLDQALADWQALPHARLNIVLSPWGLEAARALQSRYGTPYFYLGWLPVGRDLGLLIEEVGTELGLAAAQIATLRTRADARLRYFLHKLSATYVLHDLQKRVAIVGSTAYAVGLARFLAGTFGQIVASVVVTDAPSAELRADIEASIRAVVSTASVDIHFAASSEAVDAAVKAAHPELILGSALERPIAQALEVPLIEIAGPLGGAPVLLRSYAGVDGALALSADFSRALLHDGFNPPALRPPPRTAPQRQRGPQPKRDMALRACVRPTKFIEEPTMSDLKAKLYAELEFKAQISQEGITFRPEIFEHLGVGSTHQEQVHTLFEYDTDTHVGLDLPPYLVLPHGLVALFNYTRKSANTLEYDSGQFYIRRANGDTVPVSFARRPQYYGQKTSDGTEMRTVAVHNTDDVIFIAYSNECALKDTGKDCLFCNINATKDTYGEHQGVSWKYPRQIGETVAAAYREGARHLTISGGFIPERREVDYYLDVAESIKEHTGLADFNGTACIGAPHDLSVIEKYKEVGFRTLAINIEVWNEHFFRAYCPGKEQLCGGRDHWIRALEHGVEVFGRGRVRSNMVGGLEDKASTLEGIETLTSRGIIAIAPGWFPNPGSALEGHRSPEPAWHLDLAKKTAAIYRKAGFTWDQIYDANAAPITLVHDIYRIEEGRLPVFQRTTSQDALTPQRHAVPA